MAQIPEKDFLKIHLVLHTEDQYLLYQDKVYEIKRSKDNRRFVLVQDHLFIQQSKDPYTSRGKKSLAGSQITNVIYPNKRKRIRVIENHYLETDKEILWVSV